MHDIEFVPIGNPMGLLSSGEWVEYPSIEEAFGGYEIAENPQVSFFCDGGSCRVQGGRIFVGFNVGDIPTWTVGHAATVIEYSVQRWNRRNLGKEKFKPAETSASLILQEGIWDTTPPENILKAEKFVDRSAMRNVREKSVQVLVLNTDGERPEDFDSRMLNLGGIFSVAFDQEAVYLYMEENGTTYRSVGIYQENPEKRYSKYFMDAIRIDDLREALDFRDQWHRPERFKRNHAAWRISNRKTPAPDRKPDFEPPFGHVI